MASSRPTDPATSVGRDMLRRRADQVQRGGARAAVLGVNDGLVSNVCLIVGVAGANASQSTVRLAGFASLIAGAVSMAAGEWVSVRAQVELFQGVLGDLGRMIRANPDAISAELRDVFRRQGMTDRTATDAGNEVMADPDGVYRVSARALLGVNSDELGSPWTAAMSSLLLFALGAVLPLAPWIVTSGSVGIAASILLTGAGSLAVGALIGRSSGCGVVRGAIRQLLIVLFASITTYGVGAVLGTSVA